MYNNLFAETGSSSPLDITPLLCMPITTHYLIFVKNFVIPLADILPEDGNCSMLKHWKALKKLLSLIPESQKKKNFKDVRYSPVKTEGIFDMKLLTVLTGTPDASSCIFSTICSICRNINH